MNTKKSNIIKRLGVVFTVLPVWILSLLLHIVTLFTVFIWGPFYYIITGKDPINDSNCIFLDIADYFTDWYMKNFGPKKLINF